MKNNITELVFILDRSGSMSGLESDTIGGFNAMLEKQKKEEGRINVTTVLFDDKIEIVHDRVPAENTQPMTQETYYVRGCTALLDAVGATVSHIANTQKYLRPEDRADKVITVIITDGLENASRRYSRGEVKKMIELEKEKYGWEFIFLGANIDAAGEAGSIGIDDDRAVDYRNDSAGVKLNYDVVCETISCMRIAEKRVDGSWKKKIEEDKDR
ncbi:MAG: VWA domain-containing protein [Eubacteriaceae bacterium]|jgi:uncharacterized protein YegL|nr:VWA domain-containing protein [Eubacteriaceae bacterium]